VKAKFIYEALDFERGLDPKKSMSIGRYWSKTKREIASEIIKRCETELESIIQNVHAVARMKGYKNSFDYIEKAYGMENSNIAKDPVIENAIEDVAMGINNILKEYPIFEPDKNDSLMNDITNFFTAGEPPFRTLMTIIEATLDPQLKESVKFQRGRAPLKSLGIGQEALKKKLIEIIPDLSKNILWDEMYKNILTGINLQDTTVSINDEYIIITTPRLTWRFADNLRLMLNMSPTKVELEKKTPREYIYLRDSDWLKNFKTPRVYKYRIL